MWTEVIRLGIRPSGGELLRKKKKKGCTRGGGRFDQLNNPSLISVLLFTYTVRLYILSHNIPSNDKHQPFPNIDVYSNVNALISTTHAKCDDSVTRIMKLKFQKFLLPQLQTPLWDSRSLLTNWFHGLFPLGVKYRGRAATNHFYQALRLKVCEARLPLPPYVCKACCLIKRDTGWLIIININ